MLKIKSVTSPYYVRVKKIPTEVLINVHVRWAEILYGVMERSIIQMDSETDEEFQQRQHANIWFYVENVCMTLVELGYILIEPNYRELFRTNIQSTFNFDEDGSIDHLILKITFPSFIDMAYLWTEMLKVADIEGISEDDDIQKVISSFAFGTVMQKTREKVFDDG